MKFKLQEFSERTGLSLDTKRKIFWGTMEGFPVLIQYIGNRDMLIFQLSGKLTEERDVAPMLDAIKNGYHCLKGLEYRNPSMATAIALAGKDTMNEAVAVVEALISLAKQLELIPCCARCGAESGYRAYLLDDIMRTLCSSCCDDIMRNIEEQIEERAQVRTNWLGVLAGSLVGALLAFVLTFGVLLFSRLSFLTALGGIMVSVYLAQKWGKKLTPLAAIICTFFCAIAVAFAPVVKYAKDFAEFNQENQVTATEFCESYDQIRGELLEMSEEEVKLLEEETGTSFRVADLDKKRKEYQLYIDCKDIPSCIKEMPALLETAAYRNSGAKGEIIKCILIGVICVIAGSCIISPSAVKQSLGKHDLQEIGTY